MDTSWPGGLSLPSISSLRIGGRVYLDDYVRPQEQQIVRNWEATYPGVFRIRVLDFPHSPLCILEKSRDLPHARLTFSVAWDNWKDNVVRKADGLRNLIGNPTPGVAGSKGKTEE